MSVINQMLKDLENQRTQSKTADQQLLQQLKSHKRITRDFFTSSKSVITLVCCTAGVFISGAIYFIYTNHTRPIPTPSKILSIVEEQKKEPSLLASITPPIATVSGINFQQEKGNTKIEFSLDRPSWYRIAYDLADNKYLLTFDNISFRHLCENQHSLNECLTHLLPESQLGFSVSASNQQLDSDQQQLTFVLPGDASLNESNYDTQRNTLILTFGATQEPQPTEKQIANAENKNTEVKVAATPQNIPLEAQYAQAWELIQDKHLAQGLLKLELILAKKPDFKMARQSLASLLIQQGRYADASQVIHEGKRLHLNDNTFVMMEARMLFAQNKLNEAEKLLQQSHPPLDKNLDYYALLAAAFQKNNKPHEAAALYEKLVSAQPNQASWWLGLGMSREALGDKNATIEAYQQALAYQQLSPEVEGYVQNRISTLGG